MGKPTLSKKAAETFPIGFKYHPPDLESDETISSCAVAVSGPDSVLTAVTPATVSSNQVSSVVAAGTAAAEYTVTFTMTTSSSKIFVDEWIVNIE
jgi:5-enolpyruvylshikimate-3-phosphate synthase